MGGETEERGFCKQQSKRQGLQPINVNLMESGSADLDSHDLY